MQILVEGWRFISQSYAVVNQFQLLEMLKYPDLELFHREMPYLANWQRTSGILSAAEEAALANIPEPPPNLKPDVVLRMNMPFNLTPSGADRTYVFGLTENGIVQNSMRMRMKAPSLRPFHQDTDVIIITSSNWSREGFINSGADGDRVVVVPIGIDPRTCYPLSDGDRRALRTQFGWDDRFIFLNVGAMSDRKGIVPLLKAFATVVHRYPQASLVLKGNDSLYNSRDCVVDTLNRSLTESERAKVVPNLAYIGEDWSFDRVAQLYQAADAYVSPYLAEGFNMPVLEAIACGLPVICTAGGPTDDFTRSEFAWRIESTLEVMTIDREPRYIFNPNLDNLIYLMERAIGEPEFLTSSRQTGPKFVADRYTWEEVVHRLLDILEYKRE